MGLAWQRFEVNTAAALVNDLATRAHPASVFSVPTSANAEDHVSMGWAAGRKLRRAIDWYRHHDRLAARAAPGAPSGTALSQVSCSLNRAILLKEHSAV